MCKFKIYHFYNHLNTHVTKLCAGRNFPDNQLSHKLNSPHTEDITVIIEGYDRNLGLNGKNIPTIRLKENLPSLYQLISTLVIIRG